jgi:hypothetical protein
MLTMAMRLAGRSGVVCPSNAEQEIKTAIETRSALASATATVAKAKLHTVSEARSAWSGPHDSCHLVFVSRESTTDC